MTRQILLDTETTGLSTRDGHRIIEIAAIEMIDRQLTDRMYHQYIKPERQIDAGAQRVHGITKEFLADKPTFKEIASTFMEFVDGAELIIHNAPFDLGFINYEFGLLKPALPKLETSCSVIDTLAMARKKHIGQRNSLDALCKRYEVDNSNRELHGALIDSELLGLVYLAMTGGQNSLFSEETTGRDTTEQAIRYVRTTKTPLTVLKASEQEQVAHKHYLEQMEERGECVWTEED
jgi:DNA polymerase-3 subunit epsilon